MGNVRGSLLQLGLHLPALPPPRSRYTPLVLSLPSPSPSSLSSTPINQFDLFTFCSARSVFFFLLLFAIVVVAVALSHWFCCCCCLFTRVLELARSSMHRSLPRGQHHGLRRVRVSRCAKDHL